MIDRNYHFTSDIQFAVEELIETRMNETSETILNRRQDVISSFIADGPEKRFERGTGNERDLLAQQLDGGFFTECAGLALESNSWRACLQAEIRNVFCFVSWLRGPSLNSTRFMDDGPKEFDYRAIVERSAICLAHPFNHLALAGVIAKRHMRSLL